MLTYQSINELVLAAIDQKQAISQVVLTDQARLLEQKETDILAKMLGRLQVMRQAAASGLHSEEPSLSGLSGGSAVKMRRAIEAGSVISGPILSKILACALAVAEVNARMGRIVAVPTAGSCGILPAVLLTLAEEYDIPEEKVVMALITAAGIGLVIANKASLSGAEGGCQAECGSAAAMAAAAAAEMLGGTPVQVAHACALALKNVLGLVCDPVAGLVEVPCIKRNAGGAANALIAAEMALAGITSAIPADEVIEAMKRIGDIMPISLKETASGGLAETPTGRQVAARMHEIDNDGGH